MTLSMKQRDAAKRFELDLAEELDARRVFLSGAGLEKADVQKRVRYLRDTDGAVRRTDALSFRIEAKTTSTPSYTLTTVDWYALTRAAEMGGEVPLFAIRFLQTGEELLVLRAGLVHELGLGMADDEHILVVSRSRKLSARSHCLMRMIRPWHPGPTRLPDVVLVGPYRPLIEAIKQHALYAPTTAP